MELAVPIFSEDGKIYDFVEIRKPKTKIITRAYEFVEKNNVFTAMLELLSGCVVSVTSMEGEIIDNPVMIRKLMGNIPYVSAEAVALKIIGTLNENDVIEGVYKCPRCGERIIGGYDSVLGIDTRDRVSDLAVTCLDKQNYINEIQVVPENPIKFFNPKTEEVLQEIESFAIRYPTINDCIIAGRGMQPGQEIRVQMKIYIQSLLKVNGKEINKSWTATYGQLLFDELYPDDMAQIGDALQSVGLSKTIDKTCNSCGKVWEASINTSNFFASGLRPM